MKFKSLAIPAITIVGVAIFGVVLAALFADGSLFATGSSDERATRDVVFPDPPEKLQPVTISQPRVSTPQRSTASTRPEPEASDPGKVYTWNDGDRTLRVVLQTDLTVQDNSAARLYDNVVAKGAKASIVQTTGNRYENPLPVFRSESEGGLMTLPGGVLLALDPEMDQAEVESFFARNNISLDRVSELDFIDNGFFVNTKPGFPSLELANALAGRQGVLISSPNWQSERELK